MARQEGDFELYRPALEEIVALKREQADLIGYEGERYDALLDAYEPGMRVARLEPLLHELREKLVPLLSAIVAAASAAAAGLRGQRFPRRPPVGLHDAAAVRHRLRPRAPGRQDRSAHPFTQAVALHDVRRHHPHR